MDDLTELAWRGEEALLSPGVRGSETRLRELLAPDFSEIGQSGRRWDRAEVVAALVDDIEADAEVRISERGARVISLDTVLLTYRLQFGGRTSLRSSLWRRTGESVQCFFHQGTPAARDTSSSDRISGNTLEP
ncbi:DUF4440 domain-containing protein [Microbacterium oxydans]|nr:DUF4440 domain-containing protein [Microbacterium oxydans]